MEWRMERAPSRSNCGAESRLLFSLSFSFAMYLKRGAGRHAVSGVGSTMFLLLSVSLESFSFSSALIDRS